MCFGRLKFALCLGETDVGFISIYKGGIYMIDFYRRFFLFAEKVNVWLGCIVANILAMAKQFSLN